MGTFDDQNCIPITLPITILSDYTIKEPVEITRLTTPFRMGPAKLLGSLIPNGLRVYLQDTEPRDHVWPLAWRTDLDQGLVISDYDPVPILTDCPDHKVILENDIVKTNPISDKVFYLFKV